MYGEPSGIGRVSRRKGSKAFDKVVVRVMGHPLPAVLLVDENAVFGEIVTPFRDRKTDLKCRVGLIPK